AGLLEVAGVTTQGNIHVTTIEAADRHDVRVSSKSWKQPHRYRAVAWLRSGLLAGAHDHGLDLIQTPSGLFSAVVRVPLPGALACFHNPPGAEVLVICADGTLVRVPVSI